MMVQLIWLYMRYPSSMGQLVLTMQPERLSLYDAPNKIRTRFCHVLCCYCYSGPRFNIKMTSYQYRKSHCGDKTILRPSYLHNGISYTGKTTSLYWIGALEVTGRAVWFIYPYSLELLHWHYGDHTHCVYVLERAVHMGVIRYAAILVLLDLPWHHDKTA